MPNLRLIARLDVKGANLVKTVQLEGLRVVGDPNEHALRYYRDGIDEIVYMDIVASLYGRNNLADIVAKTAENVFVPITVGGGIRSVDDVRQLLLAGADKVAINTGAMARPGLLSEIAETFGSQCLVLSIEAKSKVGGGWECFTDNGREFTGRDVIDWARQAASLGIGEVLVTSVDREGTRKGFDLDLLRQVAEAVPVPVIASGGMGGFEHLAEAAGCGIDAVAMADSLHFNRTTVADIRAAALDAGLPVRKV